MTNLALAPSKSEHRHGQEYSGRIVWDLGRHVELTRQSFPARGMSTTFRYVGGAHRHTTSSSSGLTVELMLGFAESFDFEAQAVERVESFSKMLVVAPEAVVAAEVEPYWLDQMHQSKSKSLGKITNVISSALRQFQEDGHEEVDRNLAKVDVSIANDHLLVAVLRSLSSYEAQLPHWLGLVRLTRAMFESKGMPAGRIMDGLGGE